MAIFMIYDRDNTHVEPVKDARGCYKKGMIVDVLDDATPLVLPPAPPFMFIRVTGLDRQDAIVYMQEWRDSIDPKKTLGRRRHQLDWNILPQPIRNTLDRDRYYEATWAVVRQFFIDKETGLPV